MTMLVEANKAGSEKSRVRVQALWLQSVLTRSMDTKGIYWFCSLIFFFLNNPMRKVKANATHHTQTRSTETVMTVNVTQSRIQPRTLHLQQLWKTTWGKSLQALYLCHRTDAKHTSLAMFTFVTSTVSFKCWGKNTFRLHNMLKLILLHIQGYFNFRFDIC